MNGIYCWQDCLATIPPYPYYIGERGAHYDAAASISDPDSMWIVRPQLFFTCTVRPPTQPEVATTSMPKTFLSNWSSSVPLRIFSCKQLELWSQMELESCMNRRLSPLSEFGCADGQGPASRRGSHVYEVNDWLWNFGRPQPRVGGLSVSKTERIRRRCRSEASRRSWETRKARAMAADEIW